MNDPHQILLASSTIAVVGASPNPSRPSHWISKYLMGEGYTVIPVNPGHSELFGLKCYPDIESIDAEIDIVNIFRRSDQVIPIVESSIRKSGIKLVWMQDNVYNEAAAQLLKNAGIPVVMDDCIYRVHNQIK
ncbi:MAG: CoA-binding protein [Candidatus Marinimicrobia bacterium]|nr:CoA-binding protein [Candidatus Neomarinimicrobiota bacterium]MCF7922537.1 CoA-binding protein [Candidatus Neomarinimicrobiota bacterium]